MNETAEPADLLKLLESVNDQASFIHFVGELARDFERDREELAARKLSPYARGPLGWENGTIDSMLGAAEAWGFSSSKSWTTSGDTNVWRRCAHILLAGKFYE